MKSLILLFPKPYLYLIFFLLSIPLLVSCQLPVRSSNVPYLELNEAVQQLTNRLMLTLQGPLAVLNQLTPQGTLSVLNPLTPKTLIFNPFVEVDGGQIIQASLDIENLFVKEVQRKFNQFKVKRISKENLLAADYIMNGIIKYQAPHSGASSRQKYYLLIACIVDLKTKKVIAQEEIGIAGILNYAPTPSYRDNPLFFIKDRLLQNFIQIVESPVGTFVGNHFYTFIETKSLIVEAQSAYDEENYLLARQLFKKALEQTDGNRMETYGGLYITHYRLGDIEEAEKNFDQLIILAAQEGNLPTKLLFEHDSTEFLNNQELRKQYALWIKRISLYFKENPSQCVIIIGHTSRYGEYQYNKILSKQRAENIRHLMVQIFPGMMGRSKIAGIGSDETIVGTTPDSIENAIDRRVEFKVSPCHP